MVSEGHQTTEIAQRAETTSAEAELGTWAALAQMGRESIHVVGLILFSAVVSWVAWLTHQQDAWWVKLVVLLGEIGAVGVFGIIVVRTVARVGIATYHDLRGRFRRR